MIDILLKWLKKRMRTMDRWWIMGIICGCGIAYITKYKSAVTSRWGLGDFDNRNVSIGKYKRVGILPEKGEIGDVGNDFTIMTPRPLL